MFTKVLVPLDGSKFAETALPMAVAAAQGASATLELVSVHEPAPSPALGTDGAADMLVGTHDDPLGAVPVTTTGIRESLRDERTTYLHDVARRVREHSALDPVVTLLEGRADQALLQRVNEEGIDLVVMATHGRGPLERAWLGSVADRLVRELSVPILLVRPDSDAAPDLAVPPAVRRVLVALDGSSLAEAALGPAELLARALGVPIALVRAVNVRADLGSTYLPHAAQAYHDQIERTRGEAAEYIRRTSDRLAGRDLEVESAEVVEGPAPRTILTAAGEEGGDVIAMATHGRGGLRRLVLGSVSDKVVRAAAGPVLLVRPTEEDE